MSYETKKYIVTGEAANVRKFPDSSSGALVTALKKGDIVEADASGTYTNTRGGTSTVYLPVVVDGVRRWAAAGNFEEYTDTPLELAASNVKSVYESCIGCKHVSGSYSWNTAMKDKKVNCAIPASRVATLAGILPDGKRISHKAACFGDILSTKTTIAKSVSGYDNLDLAKCTVTYVGAKNFAALASKYKRAGAIYIQDSNISVYGGNGVIYSCHNWSKQLKNGKYDKVALTSGCTKNSPILVVILPND